MSHKKPDYKQEAIENISEIIRQDILPLLVQGDIHQITLENPIQDIFGTGLNISIIATITVEPISEYEFKQKEKQTRQQNQSAKNYKGIH